MDNVTGSAKRNGGAETGKAAAGDEGLEHDVEDRRVIAGPCVPTYNVPWLSRLCLCAHRTKRRLSECGGHWVGEGYS